MYLLFECGVCSRHYQLQIDKITASLQKAICTSCQTSYFFGPADQATNSSEPMIERIMSLNWPSQEKKGISAKLPSYQIHWKCGVCESSYDFNLNRVTDEGIKVTCITCLQFFVLQKSSTIGDIDHLILQDVHGGQRVPRFDTVKPVIQETQQNVYEIDVSEEMLSQIPEPKQPESPKNIQAPTQPSPLSRSITDEPKPAIKNRPEIKLPPSTSEEFLSKAAEPKIEPKKVSPPPVEKIFSESPTEEFMRKIPEPKSSKETKKTFETKPTVLPTSKRMPPVDSDEQPISAFQKQTTQPEAKVIGSEEPTVTKKAMVVSPDSSSAGSTTRSTTKTPAIQMQQNDMNLMNSFKSYHTKKTEFKIAKTHEATSVTFVDHFPSRKKSFIEKNMVKISIWAVGLAIVGLATVFTYDWYQSREDKKIIERTPVNLQESNDKPKYGFPELGE